MIAEYEYIYFRECTNISGKTKKWHCCNKKSTEILGLVKWSGNWRQYCFYPFQSTVFSKGCLADIIDFIEMEMDKWRATK